MSIAIIDCMEHTKAVGWALALFNKSHRTDDVIPGMLPQHVFFSSLFFISFSFWHMGNEKFYGNTGKVMCNASHQALQDTT